MCRLMSNDVVSKWAYSEASYFESSVAGKKANPAGILMASGASLGSINLNYIFRY